MQRDHSRALKRVPRRLSCNLWLCVAVLLWAPSVGRAQVVDCASNERCAQGAYPDLVELQDGSALCGLMVQRDEGRKVILITEAETKTISWENIRCIAAGWGKSRTQPPSAAQPTPPVSPEQPAFGSEPQPLAAPESVQDEPWAGLAVEWDLHAVGGGLLKRYQQNGETGGSWSAGGGLGAGAALRYQSPTRPKRGGLAFYTVDLGLGINISLESWHQLGGQSATLIHQDIYLALGGRIALGTTRISEDGLSWSGAMLGLAWLPTYIDFYGSGIDARSRINPAGVRLSLDIGRADARAGHSPLLRLALAYLPYTSRLPTEFWLSAGVLFF